MRDREPKPESPSLPEANAAAAGFEAIHARYRSLVLGYLHRLTRDAALAEELAQETFLRVSRSLPGFRGDSKLTTWLYRIATRVYLDHRRKEAARTVDPGALPPDLLAAPGPRGVDSTGPRLPDVLFEDSEMGRCIREFVDRLSPDYRTAIVLHDLQGLTNPEIAVVLDCSLPTVKIRVHRAREQLRELLSDNCLLECEDGVLRCDRK